MKAPEVRGKENTEIEFDLSKAEKELFDMRFRSITEGHSEVVPEMEIVRL